MASASTTSGINLDHDTPVLFFDGVCNLCNSSVDYVIRHDRSKRIKFASLQSDYASQVLPPLGVDNNVLDSLVFVQNGRAYAHSSAVIRLAIQMKGWRRVLGYLGYVVPPFLRNAIYKWVARNRYKWYGKKETCRLATPEERKLFLG